MSTPTEEELRRVQRRGRIVIVGIIALFLVACAALGIFLMQREQEESRLEELRRPGLLAVASPDWHHPIHAVEPLENNRGLVITYADEDGDPIGQLRTLNIRAGTDPDLCALLAQADADFADADRCEIQRNRVSAALLGPSTILIAEGQLRADTLVILVAHPAQFTDEQLAVWLGATDLVSLSTLLERIP